MLFFWRPVEFWGYVLLLACAAGVLDVKYGAFKTKPRLSGSFVHALNLEERNDHFHSGRNRVKQ